MAVADAEPYGGADYLADTSAWAWAERLPKPDKDEWDAALRARQIVWCPVVLYEVGQGAQTATKLAAWEERFSSLRRVAITNGEWLAAQASIRGLAELVPAAGTHRGISPGDALIAVTAARYGLGVLHYDEDFDRLALDDAVGMESRWLAPRGTL